MLAEIFERQRWERVLFTTYVISLTFFESIILRHLRKKGCQEIWVVADAYGYQLSLTERRSSRVGQEYRLIPVALPKGVFHPKCTYLSGKEGDLLLVGSGNLTFGGFGRNLEVLEILEPKAAPIAFQDFGDFLDNLADRQDIIIPEKNWLSTFASDARAAAESVREISESQPRLIHSVSQAIIEQLETACAKHGGCQEITVLSPFHSPDGGAVLNLAQHTGAKKLNIGLPGKETELSTFPFTLAKRWDLKVRAVRPEITDYDRPLHAKWLEMILTDGTRMNLTGSVNATQAALGGTDNIEVGILHLEQGQGPWITWKRVPIPQKMGKNIFSKTGQESKFLVYAYLGEDCSLGGWILTQNDPAGKWEGSLEKADGKNISIRVEVSPEGSFKTFLVGGEEFVWASGLQIQLSQGNRWARGWVHQEGVLKLPRFQNLSVSALIRFSNRESTEEDEIALLDYLALSAHRHLSTFSRRIRIDIVPGASSSKEQDRQVTINLEELAPDREILFPTEEMEGDGSGRRAMEPIFARLRRCLLGYETPTGKTKRSTTPGRSRGDETGEDEEDLAARRRLKNSLEDFEDYIRVIIDSSSSEEARRAALVIWLEVKLHMLQRRLRTRGDAMGFIKNWLWEACNITTIASDPDSLEQHVFTTAVVCASIFQHTDSEIGSAPGTNLISNLHEDLERFCSGPVAEQRALKALLDHPEMGYVSWLVGDNLPNLRESLHLILETKTIRQELAETIASFEAGEGVPEHVPVQSDIWIALFSKLRRATPRHIVYKDQFSEQAVCTHCHMMLNTMAKQDLETYRIARCESCGKFTIRLRP